MPLKWLKMTALAALFGAAALAAQGGPALGSLREEDERLLRIVEPILAANLPLCDRTMPRLGVALQSIDQYPDRARPPFAAPVAFAAVLPDSPAAQAGIVRDDGLLAIDGREIARRPELETSPLRDSAFAALAEHDPAEPLVLDIAHGTGRRQVTIAPARECRALVEILADNGSTAHSDGRVIQISYALARRASDEELAVTFAHELAHAILHHRDRLASAGVSKGLAAEFGRDRRLNREAEIEADRLSVHLLANAGLDPRIAPAFWRSQLGQELDAGLLRSRVYPSPEARAQEMESEIALYLAGGAPSYPGHLLSRRDRPLR